MAAESETLRQLVEASARRKMVSEAQSLSKKGREQRPSFIGENELRGCTLVVTPAAVFERVPNYRERYTRLGVCRENLQTTLVTQ